MINSHEGAVLFYLNNCNIGACVLSTEPARSRGQKLKDRVLGFVSVCQIQIFVSFQVISFEIVLDEYCAFGIW